ncbi:hypothetical protein AB0M80_43220 [Amycolatopsis sp. NPDC051045]|uniref:hypothetical protein n=1 Tax=Amycolatopsis sp. NPDC051045 TaxID=3156922 RepID=UPI00342B9AD6
MPSSRRIARRPRSNALDTYRFWRDHGYAAGALLADTRATTVIAAAVLTAASGLLATRWITA